MLILLKVHLIFGILKSAKAPLIASPTPSKIEKSRFPKTKTSIFACQQIFPGITQNFFFSIWARKKEEIKKVNSCFRNKEEGVVQRWMESKVREKMPSEGKEGKGTVSSN